MRKDDERKLTRSVFELDRLTSYFRTGSQEEITDYLKDILQQRGLDPIEMVIALHRHLRNDGPEMQEKFSTAISILLQRVNWETLERIDKPYLCDLLLIVGFCRIQSSYEQLVNLAEQEKLKPIKFDASGISLHRIALASLAAFEGTKRSQKVFERDIQTPETAALCYRALWREHSSFALKYLGLIKEFGLKDKEFPAEALINEATEAGAIPNL